MSETIIATMDEAKELILQRLHKSSSICTFCRKHSCKHEGNRELPGTLNTDDVLRAINYGEHFFKEAKS